MPNYRSYYPIHYIALGPEGSSSGTPVHGVQSVSMNTSFNLESVFELGQLSIYEQIENLPNVEMTAEKCLDGYPLLYHLGTPGATNKTLLNRTARKCDAVLSIFSDLQDNSSGAPLTQVLCSGMFVNSLNYNLAVQGPLTESVSFVGNDKIWKTSAFLFNGHFTTGLDAPASGVQRRQHVVMGAAAAGGSVWPTLIPGITTTAGSGYNIDTGIGGFGAHLQNVTISASLGREDLFELGKKKPYYRFVNFPVTVSTSIDVITAGNTPGDLVNALSESTNLSNEAIIVHIADVTTFDMGTKNKLSSVSYGGGSTGGEPVTISYQFQNFNDLSITARSDPGSIV